MARHRVNNILGKSHLSKIRDRALWLSQKNECLARQLPLSINTRVNLVNVDSRKRAILHVAGAEWATQVRMHQRMILAILKACGVADLTGAVIKNRPAVQHPLLRTNARRPRHRLSASTRDLIDASASSITDEGLRQSLRRLARKSV